MSKLVAILVLALSATVTRASQPPRQPATQPTISIRGIDAKTYQPLKAGVSQATVILFVLQDCPICNAYAPQLQRMAADANRKHVAFYLVHVDPALTDEQARAHAREYGYTCPVLVDRKHELVSRLGIVAVPTAVVLDSDGTVQYHGRVDDRYFALGKSREEPARHDLSDALSDVLAHRPVREPRTRTVGCAVPEVAKSETRSTKSETAQKVKGGK